MFRSSNPDPFQADLPAGRFTRAAQQAVAAAAQCAAGRHAAYVEPEHLLLGVLAAQDKLVERALVALGIAPSRINQQLEAQLAPAQAEPAPLPTLGPAVKRVIHYAAKEAQHLGAGQADVLHLLMGVLYEEEGIALDVLRTVGLSLYDLRQVVLSQPRRRGRRSGGQLAEAFRPSPVFLIPVAAMLGSGAGLWLNPAEMLVRPLTMLFIISGWIVSLCLHEFGHALAAYLGGDLSVKDAGYLTLNPLKYSHPLFSIVMPLLFLMIGGIGLPGGAVYINRHALRSSTWESIVSAAGPLGTALFGALTAWPFLLGWQHWVTQANWHFWPALAYLACLQVGALVFNLIPVPPLDGFGIIAPRLPIELRVRALMFGNIALILLFVLLLQDGPISQAFWQEIFRITDRLHIPPFLIFEGQDQVFW